MHNVHGSALDFPLSPLEKTAMIKERLQAIQKEVYGMKQQVFNPYLPSW
jgi:hypothetical protein